MHLNTHTHKGKTTATENKWSKAWTHSFEYKSVSRLSLNIQSSWNQTPVCKVICHSSHITDYESNYVTHHWADEVIWISHKYHLNRHAVTDLSLVESDAWDCKSPAPTPGRHHALQTPEAIMYMHVSTFTSALKPSRFEALVLPNLVHSGTSHSSHLAVMGTVLPSQMSPTDTVQRVRSTAVVGAFPYWLKWHWTASLVELTYTVPWYNLHKLH